MHHASIRTADIHRSIAFYEQLGFQVCERFTTGYTLACWMEGLGDELSYSKFLNRILRPMLLGMSIMLATTICHLTLPLKQQICRVG